MPENTMTDEALTSDVAQLDAADLRPVSLPIAELRLPAAPRRSGLDREHAQLLAESAGPLAPVVVHGPTMRVVDGEHRVRAALLRGADRIDALLYHGSAADGFVLAVRMNIAYGLPLSRADRTRAAARIIGSHPHWSNRMIASVTGLAAGTIADLRRQSAEPAGARTTRIGKDGRVRPVNGADGRRRVVELLTAKPEASLRAIAREAGVSPATVCTIRQRLRAGRLAPVTRQRPADTATGAGAAVPDVARLLEPLMKDPHLRFSDSGRVLLRWLNGQWAGMDNKDRIAPLVPDHCASLVAELARGLAMTWGEFAALLDERAAPQPD